MLNTSPLVTIHNTGSLLDFGSVKVLEFINLLIYV